MAYKLVEYAGRPALKLSAEKVTMPGRKQVRRTFGADGRFKADTITLSDEDAPPPAETLLVEVMKNGEQVFSESIDDARARCAASLEKLPKGAALITSPEKYEVRRSEALKDRMDAARRLAEEQISKPGSLRIGG